VIVTGRTIRRPPGPGVRPTVIRVPVIRVPVIRVPVIRVPVIRVPLIRTARTPMHPRPQ
jgi:hypothetical protein